MHSDIGGGYPPGDQGKANAKHDGYLLSQIVLHDLYSSAFSAGAPLKVNKFSLPESLRRIVGALLMLSKLEILSLHRN